MESRFPLGSKRRTLYLAAALAGALLVPVAAAQATVFPVDTTADTNDGSCGPPSGNCSLREAVLAANAAGSDDSITVPTSGTPYALTITGADEEAAATGDLDILPNTGTLSISGDGLGTVFIDGNDTDRIFDLRANPVVGSPDANLSLSGLVLTDGSVVASGGAIRSDEGTLNLNSTALASNLSTGEGGAIYNDDGVVTVSGGIITDNTGSQGGAVANDLDGTLSIFGSGLSGNQSTGNGGTIHNDADSRTTIMGSSIGDSVSGSHGGTLYNNNNGVFDLSDVFITTSQSGGNGGAIYNNNNGRVDYLRGQILDSTAAGDGGAIFNQNSAQLTLTDMTLDEGQTTGPSARGGGIFNQNDAQVTIARSTLSRNTATEGGAVFSQNRGALTAVNSTISGNGAADQGGGFFSSLQARVTLTNVTVANNSAGNDGGGIYNDTSANGPPFTSFTFKNTIVADNQVDVGPPNCTDGASAVPPASNGNNLESASSCHFTGAGDLQNTDPLLGPLQISAGLTETHELLDGSPAIDAGSNDGCPTTDQRMFPRPDGPACDIGAFEVFRGGQPPPPPPPADTDGDGVPNSSDRCPTVPAPTADGCPLSTPPLPPPVLGVAVNVAEVKGEVFVSVPLAARAAGRLIEGRLAQSPVPGLKGRRFVPLSQARQIPVGSLLDTRKGTVRIASAGPTAGKTQSGQFAAGVFQVLQSRQRRAKGLTELSLKGSSFSSCRKPRRGKRASASASRRIRRLSSNTRGRFRTRGRHSSATVRGTKWTITDRCDGTLTQVARGKVAVRDFRRKKTIVVKAGKKYLAKAPR